MHVIPYSSVPDPIPAGLMHAIEEGLVAAGFNPTASRAPEGILVSDAKTALAVIKRYSGSAFQLAWHKSNFSGTGLFDRLAVIYEQKYADGRSYGGKTFQIDHDSVARISHAAALGLPCVWIAADNSRVSMSAARMADFGSDVVSYVSALTLNNRALKDAIKAATSMSALAKIDINAGWPSNNP